MNRNATEEEDNFYNQRCANEIVSVAAKETT